MFNVEQLRELVIKPTLTDMVMYSEDAMELLVFTCAVESEGGTYLKQIHGPALGIYQMEPETYNDIWANFLKGNNSILLRLISNFGIVNMPSEDRMIYDLRFATAMVRLHYLRVPANLPDKDNVEAIWKYYKAHYNTYLGKADKTKSLKLYQEFIKA